MADHCIVIADDSGDESDDSLPSFSQTLIGLGGTTTSQIKSVFPDQRVTAHKKTPTSRAMPEVVYDLTASPNGSCRASSPSPNTGHVGKQPPSSISVDSRSDAEPSNSGSPFHSLLTGRTHGNCSQEVSADSDSTADLGNEPLGTAVKSHY